MVATTRNGLRRMLFGCSTCSLRLRAAIGSLLFYTENNGSISDLCRSYHRRVKHYEQFSFRRLLILLDRWLRFWCYGPFDPIWIPITSGGRLTSRWSRGES